MNHPLKFADLIGNSFPIELGSSQKTQTWDADSLSSEIKAVIMHNLFDSDFFCNWTDDGKKYRSLFEDSVLKSLMNDLNATLNAYFVFQKTPYSTLKDVLVFKFKDSRNFIDNWFNTNNSIPKGLKEDYFGYRKEYFGVSL